ncbi:MAG: hypothetical protein NTU52_03660 [Actinobacteria bacterium]|nr:hypothetical protein [Actinomycetota bacterium]
MTTTTGVLEMPDWTFPELVQALVKTTKTASTSARAPEVRVGCCLDCLATS